MVVPDSVETLRETLEVRRREGSQPGILTAYRELGRAYLCAGRLDEAESALRTSIAQARIWGDPVEVGLGLLELGRAQRGLGRSDRALLALTEAAAALGERAPDAREAAAAEIQSLGSAPGGAR